MESRSCCDVRQLFLALTLVKSKPANVSVKDYILKLRKFIKPLTSGEIRTGQSYLDGAASWKNAYTESENAQTALRDRIYELERQNDLLQAKLRAHRPRVLSDSSPNKRRCSETGVDSSGRPTKRARTGIMNVTPNVDDTRTSAVLNDMDAVLTSLDTTNTYLRRFFQLQRTMAKRTITSDTICQSILQLHNAILDILKSPDLLQASIIDFTKTTQSGGKKRVPNVTSDKEAITVRIDLILRMPEYSIKAFDKLDQIDKGRRNYTQAIYSLLKVVQRTLGTITRISMLRVSETVAKIKKPASGRKSTKIIPADTDTSIVNKDDIRSQLSDFLVKLIACHNSGKAKHKAFVDGALFLILTRAGTLMRNFTLTDEKYANRVISVKGPIAAVEEQGPWKLAAMEEEAPYLIWIVDRVTYLTQLLRLPRDRETTVEAGSIDRVSSLYGCNPTRKAELWEQVQTKLQNSLLHAVFEDDSVDFESRLKSPPDHHSGPIVLTHLKEGKEDIKETFTQELWRIFAWDVLYKKQMIRG